MSCSQLEIRSIVILPHCDVRLDLPKQLLKSANCFVSVLEIWLRLILVKFTDDRQPRIQKALLLFSIC